MKTSQQRVVEKTQIGEPAERKFRVLMIAPTSFFADYGCHVRILEEARALQRLGHKVTIVTYHNGRDLADLEIQRTLPIPWRQHYEVGSSRHKIAFDGLLGLKTIGLLMQRRFDVIHAHLHEGALIGLVFGKLFGIPVLFDFQGSLTEEMIDHKFLRRDGFAYGPLRRLESWIDQTSSLIFTSSSNAERVLVEDFQCKPEQICPLPDCVNTQIFRPATEFDPGQLTSLRRQLGVPEEARVIVYLGLLAEYQGTGHLLGAMAKIRALHDDVYLLLMGFPGIDHYRRIADTLGVADRVIFTGRVPYEDAPQFLALGDIAVAPKLSLTEGAGKLLNYMAVALPTVAFDTPVAHEYLGASGIFAERGDVDSLAKKLLLLLDDQEKRQVLGHSLRQRAIERFEWRYAAHTIVQAYTQIVTPGVREAVKQSDVPWADRV